SLKWATTLSSINPPFCSCGAPGAALQGPRDPDVQRAAAFGGEERDRLIHEVLANGGDRPAGDRRHHETKVAAAFLHHSQREAGDLADAGHQDGGTAAAGGSE